MFRRTLFSIIPFALLSAVVYAGGAAQPTPASDKAAPTVTSFDAAQQKDIGIIVREYLLQNPEVLAEVAQKLRAKQLETSNKDVTAKITQNMSKLINANSPNSGNPKATVYLVEFFDYQCGHCKNMNNTIKTLIQDNANLQVVYKNLAVLGQNSLLAARFALAAGMQGKYLEMHEALMKMPNLTEEGMMQEAKKLGLDTAKLEKDLNSDQVNKEIMQTNELASALGIRGTPAFVVTPKSVDGKEASSKIFFVPGAVPKTTLEEYIKKSGA